MSVREADDDGRLEVTGNDSGRAEDEAGAGVWEVDVAVFFFGRVGAVGMQGWGHLHHR